MFTLGVCVCFCVNVTIKVLHYINGNANTNAEIGSEPILCVNVNFYGDVDANVNADVKCEQTLNVSSENYSRVVFKLVYGPGARQNLMTYRPLIEYQQEK